MASIEEAMPPLGSTSMDNTTPSNQMKAEVSFGAQEVLMSNKNRGKIGTPLMLRESFLQHSMKYFRDRLRYRLAAIFARDRR